MRDNFDISSCRLPQFSVEVWFGWVYVNLDPEAEPLAPRLAGLTERYESYKVSTYRSLFTAEEVWDTNWKISGPKLHGSLPPLLGSCRDG